MSARLLLPFALVSTLALLASGCGGGGGSAAEATNDDIATVGSIHLTKTRFVDEISRARASLEAQKQPFPKEGTTAYEELKAQAIWLLVLEAAKELEADRLGIEVTDEQVDAYIANLKKTSFDNNQAKLEKELEKEGLTMAEARHLIRGRLISDQLTGHITEGVSVSDDAVHDYYVENKAAFPPEREVQYILVGKNKEKLAKEIYDKLQGGATFAAMAKQYSQDDTTKNTGGKLTAKKGQLAPKFEEVAFSLKKGELGTVDTPEYGWFVIKALKPVKQTTEKDVTETIRAQLLQEKSNEAMTDWANDLAHDICNGDEIEYQIGYTPNPDPCAQYRAPATDTAP
jgi:foldase protein PrsA